MGRRWAADHGATVATLPATGEAGVSTRLIETVRMTTVPPANRMTPNQPAPRYHQLPEFE
jgi:hypothetical protein